MDLVDDHQSDLAHVAALLPMPAHAVPLLGRGAQDVCRGECARVGSRVARELLQREAELANELGLPVRHPLAHQRLEGGDVHSLPARMRREKPKRGELGGHRLARAGGRADQHVGVGVESRVEKLGLHL